MFGGTRTPTALRVSGRPFKRGYRGTFHHVSPKHLHRYVSEFAALHNLRIQDTEAIMAEIAARMVGKRLMYRDLTAD